MYTKLISWTANPMEAILAVWYNSKGNEMWDVSSIKSSMAKSEKFKYEAQNTFLEIIKQDIPVAENVDFVFMIYDDPISHREQMVRHRVGTHYGDNYGVDVIPDISDSTWWSESMRIVPFDKLYDEEKFYTPKSIERNEVSKRFYLDLMEEIQGCYRKLLDLGIPMEDARNVLPLASTMDISWKLNLSSMLKIFKKRVCWILQSNMWQPIISSMKKELIDKVDPLFNKISLPPCLDMNKQFSECKFDTENRRRISRVDKLPPCPLYMEHDDDMAEKGIEWYTNKVIGNDCVLSKQFCDMLDDYEILWDMNLQKYRKTDNE